MFYATGLVRRARTPFGRIGILKAKYMDAYKDMAGMRKQLKKKKYSTKRQK